MGITTHLEGILEQLETQFGLSSGQLATAVGTTSRTLDRWRTGESFPQREARHRLDHLIALSERLDETFATPESVLAWLRANSTYLGGLKPVEVLQAGRVDRVLAAIEALDSGAFL